MARSALSGTSRWRVLAAVAAVVVLVAGVAALVSRGLNPTSAELGREGVRTLQRAPDDLPTGIVPEDATQVQGTVARGPGTFTATVTFLAPVPRDEVVAHVDSVVRAAGFTFRQRSFDDVVLQASYVDPGGQPLTTTFETVTGGTGVTITLQGTPPR